jgi:aspartyl-tRNA(Asn)/glutamyl-tRNA(Gln) amidotransferase subunit C
MISEKEVKHIAKLARIGLKEKEVKKFQKELSSILDYIEKLKKVDVSKVEPMFHPRATKNVFRKDEAKNKGEKIFTLLEAMSEVKENYLKVKKII